MATISSLKLYTVNIMLELLDKLLAEALPDDKRLHCDIIKIESARLLIQDIKENLL